MLRLSYPAASSIVLVPVTETILFFCQQVDTTADCKLFWVESGKSRTFLGNFCGCCHNAQLHGDKNVVRLTEAIGQAQTPRSILDTYRL
jgi:hypothetical protein